MVDTQSFKLREVSPNIGAEITGINLAEVIDRGDRQTLSALEVALNRYIVVKMPKQNLTPQQIEKFGANFGPLLNLKRKENTSALHVDGVEYLKVISNGQTADGKPLGDGSAKPQDWHTDGAMKPLPATYTYFYGRVIPVAPPKTFWMNMYKVYESVPDDIRTRIQDLSIIHHQYTAGNEFPLPPTLPLEQRLQGAVHPIVRVHPKTGRPILYLPHRDDALVVGLSVEESFELVRTLRAHASNASEFQWGSAMQVGDFVMWDNRSSLHRRDGWDASEDRIVWHLANKGERSLPFIDSAAGAFASNVA